MPNKFLKLHSKYYVQIVCRGCWNATHSLVHSAGLVHSADSSLSPQLQENTSGDCLGGFTG